MRHLILGLGLLACAAAGHGQDFTRTMTPAEQTAAGLGKLTPEELARLKAAVERYKSGEVSEVKRRAEQEVAAAEAKARAAETRTAEPARKGPGWLGALITLKQAEENPARNEALEARLTGDFKGWRRGTIFDLDNGQRWQHVEGDDYVTPPVPAPRVSIYPGAFGTFWMQIEGVKPKLRVRPLKLE